MAKAKVSGLIGWAQPSRRWPARCSSAARRQVAPASLAAQPARWARSPLPAASRGSRSRSNPSSRSAAWSRASKPHSPTAPRAEELSGRLAEQAAADVAAGGGELAQLVEQVHGGQVGRGHLERGAQAAGPEGHGVCEQALDQVGGGVLEGEPVAVGKAAEAEPDASGGFLDGQGQGAVGHTCGIPHRRTRKQCQATARAGPWARAGSSRLLSGHGDPQALLGADEVVVVVDVQVELDPPHPAAEAASLTGVPPSLPTSVVS